MEVWRSHRETLWDRLVGFFPLLPRGVSSPLVRSPPISKNYSSSLPFFKSSYFFQQFGYLLEYILSREVGSWPTFKPHNFNYSWPNSCFKPTFFFFASSKPHKYQVSDKLATVVEWRNLVVSSCSTSKFLSTCQDREKLTTKFPLVSLHFHSSICSNRREKRIQIV